MSFPQIAGSVPTVTAQQMAEVDRLATGPYGIDLLQMMELAGRALARVVQRALPSGHADVTVVAGGGGNGGGAMVCGRRLAGLGLDVTIVLDREVGRLSGAAAHQASALEAIGVPLSTQPPSDAGAIVIDGLIGYGLTDAPIGHAAELINWIGASNATVVALDVPSGVDASSGESPGESVAADFTMTLALPKSGLIELPAAGRLLLADIAVPPALWRAHFGLETGRLFVEGDVVDLTAARLSRPDWTK
jgi:NAD(P)H-hydrate epimerase